MTDIPKYTKAAILVEQRKPLVVETVKLPSQLHFGQVLVEVKVSGICGSQLGEIDGVKGPDKYLPHLLGHEGFGKVLKIGPGVKTVEVNDSVILHWRKGLGIESEPPKYTWKEQILNAGWVTTFNKYAVISENRCTTVAPNLNPEVAALFGCAVTTGFGVIENNAKIKIGESLLVFGAGGIGLNIIQAGSLKAAYPIIAVDLFNSRLKLAKKFGATHCINSSEKDVDLEIRAILKDQKLDVFVDNTGNSKIIEKGYGLVHSKGRVVLVGVPKHSSLTSLNTLPLHFGKSLIGSHGGESIPQEDIPRYLRMYEIGSINFDNLITSRFALEEINEAIQTMRLGETAGRVMINLNNDY